MTVALAEVGTMEVGNNDGERVREYLASTKLGPGYPWCSAFVHWSYRKCGQTWEPAREFAAAKRWSQGVQVWRHGQEERGWDGQWGHPFERISEDGDLFCLYYKSLGRIGHVGIITGEDEDYLISVEGNTGSGGEREGSGVFKRKRLKSGVYGIYRWE